MKVKGIPQPRLEVILKAQGLTATITKQGNYLHIRPKRLTPAYRIAPQGSAWQLTGVDTERCEVKIYSPITGNSTVTKLHNTRTLGNADWYDLTRALLGANDAQPAMEREPVTVKLLDQSFETVQDLCAQ